MTWRVNFVRSKDAQKQLARTSLSLEEDATVSDLLFSYVIRFNFWKQMS